MVFDGDSPCFSLSVGVHLSCRVGVSGRVVSADFLWYPGPVLAPESGFYSQHLCGIITSFAVAFLSQWREQA